MTLTLINLTLLASREARPTVSEGWEDFCAFPKP